MEQSYIFAHLEKPRPIKYPAQMRPGAQIKIISIHPNDLHFFNKDKYLGKTFILGETPEERCFSRTEAISTNPVRRSFVACDIIIDGKPEYFTAVRIERAHILDQTFKAHIKQGRI
jgi:hypothetical protein